MKGGPGAAAAAGLVLFLGACSFGTCNQTGSNLTQTSPSTEASSSPSPSPSPSTSPAASPSPSPSTAPTPAVSPSPAKLIITSLPFHLGEVGLVYAPVALGAKGGVPPYKWSLEGGALPPGLALSTGGHTTGKPTASGTFSFVVRVDDSAGGAAGVPRTIFVFRQIAFTTTRATCTGDQTTGCTTTLKYTGGASNATPKLSVTLDPKTPLPPGSTFTAKAGIVTVSIKPQCSSFTAFVTLVLVDQSPCTIGYKCSSAPASVAITQTQSC
jgi:hypothetical protein